ncbi:MAG: hypothetical protein ACFFCW_07170, partial [Candidatus Hodarchaeota archaeon]
IMFILPNSQVEAGVASKLLICAGGKRDGRGVIPDYEVKQKPEDTAKGVDIVLQFTLNLIKNSEAKKRNECLQSSVNSCVLLFVHNRHSC